MQVWVICTYGDWVFVGNTATIAIDIDNESNDCNWPLLQLQMQLQWNKRRVHFVD